MNKLLECSPPPWFAWCPSDSPSANPNQTWLLHGPNPKNYDKSLGYSEADTALLAAAFDHALIGWALVYGSLNFEWGNDGVEWFHSDDTVSQPIEIDPFGFPVLTDDLRARLILEMEAAK